MSSIQQFQRRAIESLWRKLSKEDLLKVKWPEIEIKNSRFFYNSEEVYLLGVSRGVGTCSDIPNLDVAVFGNFEGRPPHLRQSYGGQAKLLKQNSRISLAVLVRKPTPDELTELADSQTCWLIVEILFVAKQKDKLIEFASYKNLKAIYCHLA